MQKRLLFMLCCGVLALSLPGKAAQPTADELIKGLAAAAARIDTLQATIVQERTANNSPQKYEFKFYRAGNDRLRVEMGAIWMIRNGADLFIKMGDKVTKQPADDSKMNPMFKGNLFFQFFIGRIDATQFKKCEFVKTETFHDEQVYVLKITPKGLGYIHQVWLRAKDYMPVKALIKNAVEGSSDTTATVKECKLDQPIDQALFTYTGPLAKTGNGN